MKQVNLILSTLAVAIAVAGCTTYEDKRGTDNYHAQMNQVANEQVIHAAGSVTQDAKRAAQDVDRPYITGKAIPLSREVTLPAPLRSMVDTTLLFKDADNLMVLANGIKDATGIPVKVMPDAMLPLEMFMPRLAEMRGGAMPFAAPTAPMAGPIALSSPLPGAGSSNIVGSAAPSSGTSYLVPVQPKALDATVGRRTLAIALDAIALRLGVYWKYDDEIAAIVFYRTETRTFEIRGAELTPSSEMSIELSGALDSQNSTGLSSTSKTKLDMQFEKEGQMKGVVDRISQFMSKAGAIAAGAGGTIVVTDTKTALDRIGDFVKQENRSRNREIEFVFEEITVEKNTSSQNSVNWNLAFNGGGSGNNVNTSGLNSLLEQEGAAASLGASVGSGPWKGTSIAVQALSKLGKVVDQKVNTFGAINGKPAISGRPQRQKYIDKLEQTQSFSDNSAPTISVTQAEEISGRILTVLPFAYADGDINLTFKYDNTPTPIFVKQTLPDGSYVQSPSSVGDVLARTAILHSGQPYVISAQSTNTTQYDERRTDRKASVLFGGSDIADNSNRITVLVLTAMVREK